MEAKKVAIFDIDGTLFRSSLLVRLIEALIEAGVFPQKARRMYLLEYQRWLDRRGSYDEYIEATIDAFIVHIKGVHYGIFADVAQQAARAERNRLYRFTRDLLRDLKRRDYYLLAISQSPKTILDPFCKRLGFNKVYGRIYTLGPQDRFTGEIEDLHLIGNKATILKRAVEKEGLTLRGSVGVGDTQGDIAFLELVDRPICFNPNADLYRHARRAGWPIVVERKDVIYKL